MMASNFDSFDQSQVKEFRQSQLLERNADGVEEGNLFIGGAFSALGLVNPVVFLGNMAVWDGIQWNDLIGGGLFGRIEELIVFNNELVAVGTFRNSVSGVNVEKVGSYDGSTWKALGPGITDPTSTVFAATVFRGKLVVAGDFSVAGGAQGDRIAEFDGVNWNGLGGGMNRPVADLTTYDIGGQEHLIAVGAFTRPGGNIIRYLAAWDGAIWKFVDQINFNNITSRAEACLGLGALLFVGGQFRNVTPPADPINLGGMTFHDGVNFNKMLDGLEVNGICFELEVFGGNIYIMGSFIDASGVLMNHITFWNGSNYNNMDNGFPADENVGSLTVFENGLVVTGAKFSQVGSAPVFTNRIVNWTGSAWQDKFDSGINLANSIGVEIRASAVFNAL